MACNAQKLDLDLQRSIGKLAHNLRLGDDFRGHEVEKQHAQRTNVLMHGAMLGHDEDVLALENRRGRQCVRNSNWHEMLLFG